MRRVLSQGTPRAPMREYLDACAANTDGWEPEEAADALGREVGRVLGVDPDDKLSSFACRELLIAAAALRIRPAGVCDWAPILVGPQGCGKTSFLEGLLPPELSGYVSLDYALDVDVVERATEANGKALLGIEDLQGLQRATRGALRKMVTERWISARLKYSAHSSRVLRTWAIVVTANEDEDLVLSGDEDSRRWLIVGVNPPLGAYGYRMAGRVAQRRDRWWGLATVAARQRAGSGEVASRVPRALYGKVAARARQHAPEDSIAEAVRALLPKLIEADEQGEPLRGEMIFSHVTSDVDLNGEPVGVARWGNGRSRDAQAMYRALRREGMERRLLNGVSVWRKPKRPAPRDLKESMVIDVDLGVTDSKGRVRKEATK